MQMYFFHISLQEKTRQEDAETKSTHAQSTFTVLYKWTAERNRKPCLFSLVVYAYVFMTQWSHILR